MKKLLVKGLLLTMAGVSLVGCGKETTTTNTTDTEVRVTNGTSNIRISYQDGLDLLKEVIGESDPTAVITFDEDTKTYTVYRKVYEKEVFESIVNQIKWGKLSKEYVIEEINWNNVKEAANEAANIGEKGLASFGIYDTYVMEVIGDETGSEVYLISVNGEIVYDVFDDIQ